MRFSRRFPVSDALSLPKIERHLRLSDVRVSRRDERLSGELFRWSDFLGAKDADRLSWRRLRAERRDAFVHLELDYNWTLQLAAQACLSAFVFALVARFGEARMLAPMLATANGIFFVASAVYAHLYADRFTRELSEAAELNPRVPATLSQ